MLASVSTVWATPKVVYIDISHSNPQSVLKLNSMVKLAITTIDIRIAVPFSAHKDNIAIAIDSKELSARGIIKNRTIR